MTADETFTAVTFPLCRPYGVLFDRAEFDLQRGAGRLYVVDEHRLVQVDLRLDAFQPMQSIPSSSSAATTQSLADVEARTLCELSIVVFLFL